jgi:hypothetical protein
MSPDNTSRQIRNNDASGEVVEHRYLVVAGEWTNPHSSAVLKVFSAKPDNGVRRRLTRRRSSGKVHPTDDGSPGKSAAI